MKITVKQQDLSRGLSTVSHAVSSRSTLPILANILIVTEQIQGRIKLSATNLEIGITCYIPAEVHEPGSTTTPAKTILDLVSSLRPVDLEVEVSDNHTMSIKGKGVAATVKGMDASEYPQIPTAQGNETPVHIDACQLKEVISMVAIAAADDDARPILTAVFIESTASNDLVFAAADAFRLATMTLPGEYPLGNDPVLVPAKTLEQLARILPFEGTVQMIVTSNHSQEPNQVLFHTDNVDLVSRLIEGTFPNFRGIMPKEHTTRAVVETKEFSAAVKMVTPFARDSSNIARIKVTPAGDDEETGSLTIEATAEDVGSNVSTINAVVEGPEQTIIFNVKYLQDVLSALDTPEVALELVSSAKPGVIKPVGGGDYTYIIMPMSTNR